MDDHADPAVAGSVEKTTAPPSSTTSVSPSRVEPGEAVQEVPAGEARDERVGGSGDKLVGRPSWSSFPVRDHADPVGERGRVLEVVRDEDRRQPEVAEEPLQLGSDIRARVGVERGHRLVEEQHRGSRASARASATRWRSPPESSDGRAFARCPMPNRSSSSADALLPPKPTFRSTERCGKSA